MIADAETGLKKLNKIRLNGVTERNDAIKAMYDLLKSIKDGEVASFKSGPDFKTFREHYVKVCGHSPGSVVRENSCLKNWERFFGADLKISKIAARQILAYRGQPMTVESIVEAVGSVFSPWKIKNVLKKKSTGSKAVFTRADGKYTLKAAA